MTGNENESSSMESQSKPHTSQSSAPPTGADEEEDFEGGLC